MEKIICGDALEQLRTLQSESVHVCVTSPPYYNLRNYDTPCQIGMEPTPEAYIERLAAVFREVRRILRPDGTLWVNIGDSYAARSGMQSPGNTRNSFGHTRKSVPDGYKYKDLMGIPWMLAFALRADGWFLRQDIIWHKTNCLPESVRDRCTKSHEYIFLLSKSSRYYFDAAAISEPIADSTMRAITMRAMLPRFGGKKYGESRSEESRIKSGNVYVPTLRRNKRDVWSISTAGYKGAHFAVFPEKLVEPCILAGSPQGGTVLDPFTGSGTTGVVAKRLGRDFIGVDCNQMYCNLAEERIKTLDQEAEK